MSAIFSTPKPPVVSQAPLPPAAANNTAAIDARNAAAEEERRKRSAGGSASTRLTSALGITKEPDSAVKALLGV